MIQAPIALFAYARPQHLARTIASLRENEGAAGSDLFVFCDAARSAQHMAAVEEVRALAATITGFRSVTVRHRPHNFGLARSIISGVGEVLETGDRVIVLEDDMTTSRYFLEYMNLALETFANQASVASVHAYSLPTSSPLPEAFFLRGADCWGWGTWRRAWEFFNPDGSYLLGELERRDLISSFDFDGAYPFSRMLKDQIAGRNDSWAIRWHASAYLADMLTLHPGRSLVRNTGTDGSGTHGGDTNSFDTSLANTPIDLSGVSVAHSDAAYATYRDFYRRTGPGPLRKALSRLRALMRSQGAAR